MKTSVELDEEKLRRAKELYPQVTMRKILDLAIDALIARGKNRVRTRRRRIS